MKTDSAQIHPAAIIEDGVTLGAGCVIHAGAVLRRGTRLGDRVTVHAHAVLGGEPQDLRFDPATVSGVRVGAGTTVREHVTINRATKAGADTVVGDNCFLMAACHVGHDCVVGNHVVMANAALLAGHVQLGDHVFVGGAAAFHQFVQVGESVMVGGLTVVSLDLPPFVLAAERNQVIGLNLVGLKRRGFSREVIRGLKAAFHAVYFNPGNLRELAARALASDAGAPPEVRRFLEFFAGGKRGFARARRAQTEGADDAG